MPRAKLPRVSATQPERSCDCPGTNIVSGHELCAAAPNGAPDCGSASVALCKSKGFQRGTGLDITSAFKCPAQMWREGRAPNPQECRDESFVSRAICQ
jgi:hypothetical protein